MTVIPVLILSRLLDHTCISESGGSHVGPQCCHLPPHQGIVDLNLHVMLSEKKQSTILSLRISLLTETILIQFGVADCTVVRSDRGHLVGQQEVRGEQGGRGRGEFFAFFSSDS